jgi:NADH-quinone oxidoreductase subunit C
VDGEGEERQVPAGAPVDADAVGGRGTNPPSGVQHPPEGTTVAEAAGLPEPPPQAPGSDAPVPRAEPAVGGAPSDPALERRIAEEQRAAAEAAKAAAEPASRAALVAAAKRRAEALAAAKAAAGRAGGPAGAGATSGPASGAAAPPPLPPELEAFRALVARKVPGLQPDTLTVGLPAFRVARERLLEVCRALRGDPELGLEYLACLSGVDYPDRIDVVYHLFSIARPGRGLVLKCGAPKEAGGGEDGALPWLPSVTSVWPGANWHEREVFDLLGVRFLGHPDLRRILMPEGFDGGYPLRKDYVDRREQRPRKVRPR